MNDEELRQYSFDFRREHTINPLRLFRANGKEMCRNLPDSGKRHPWHHRGDWMDYWKMMTGSRGNVVVCSTCGELIYVDIDADDMPTRHARQQGIDMEEHQAVGGHIEVRSDSVFHQGIYITPQCKECNRKEGERMQLRIGSVMVPEINPEIDE